MERSVTWCDSIHLNHPQKQTARVEALNSGTRNVPVWGFSSSSSSSLSPSVTRLHPLLTDEEFFSIN